jgi:hypothetical protein
MIVIYITQSLRAGIRRHGRLSQSGRGAGVIWEPKGLA